MAITEEHEVQVLSQGLAATNWQNLNLKPGLSVYKARVSPTSPR